MAVARISAPLAPHIARLLETNRENLIKSAVVDHATQAKLIEISKSINEIKKLDPNVVAAWGLGCGGVCVVSAGGEVDELAR